MFDEVKYIRNDPARAIVAKYHYARGFGRGVRCYGAFVDGRIAGVVVFGNACSEEVRRSVAGEAHRKSIFEVQRIALVANVENAASCLLAAATKQYVRDNTKVRILISFADSTENHIGYLYQASNYDYCGMTPPKTFYVDETGTLRHPRQCGVNITQKEALARGWKVEKRLGKHRYMRIVGGTKKEKAALKKALLWQKQPYPKTQGIVMQKSHIQGAAFKSLTRADKVALVRAHALDVAALDPSTTANAHARAAAEHFDAPFNTMRGLLHSAFEAHERPWLTVAGYDDPAVIAQVQLALTPAPVVEPVVEPLAAAPTAPVILDPVELAAYTAPDTAPRGLHKRQLTYEVVDGRFVPTSDAPIHVCPRCGKAAHNHDDIASLFGLRTQRAKGKARAGMTWLSYQSLCKTCKTAARRVERARKADADVAAAKVARSALVAERKAKKNRKLYGDNPPPNTRAPKPADASRSRQDETC